MGDEAASLVRNSDALFLAASTPKVGPKFHITTTRVPTFTRP